MIVCKNKLFKLISNNMKMMSQRKNKTFYYFILACFLLLVLMKLSRERNTDKVERAIHSPVVTSERKRKIRQLWGLDHRVTYWPDYFDTLDEDGLAILTKETQKWIYDKLHPPIQECSKQKFIVPLNPAFGLGSVIHMHTAMLAEALENNKILIFNPTGKGTAHLTEQGCGRGSKHNSLLCYFQPPSSCSYEHVTPENSEELGFGSVNSTVPSILKKRLQKAMPDIILRPEFYKFWWRAQAAAYLIRLNNETYDILASMRMDPIMNQGNRIFPNGTVQNIPVPFPFPKGTMVSHVRHGDKFHEMPLVPFTEYVKKAETFVSENPFNYKKMMYVLSDDKEVIHEATVQNSILTDTMPNEEWIMFTSKINRIDTAIYEQVLAEIANYGKTKMTLEWLMQLMMALECDVFIGTLGSNWSRLIAELRCIWIDSCEAPFLEVNNRQSWSQYEW